MDDGPDWLEIRAQETAPPRVVPPSNDDHLPRWLIGAVVSVVAGICALAIWITLPSGSVALESSAAPREPRAAIAIGSGVPPSLAANDLPIVVDVEGAVAQPGLHQIAASARVGDAIQAAGGFAPDVDIEVTSRTLNLAAKVADGQQIRVPALGDAAAPAPSLAQSTSSQTGGATGALIDINHASADELDTLPGIGPVTAAKIIDARTQAPFVTVDELQSRGVVGPSTFDKLRDLVTVGP